jgi:predicted MFS family arabinose efflux permease
MLRNLFSLAVRADAVKIQLTAMYLVAAGPFHLFAYIQAAQGDIVHTTAAGTLNVLVVAGIRVIAEAILPGIQRP